MTHVLPTLFFAACLCAWFWRKTPDDGSLRPFVVLALASVQTLAVSAVFLASGRDAFPFDDSYISLAAARNLLAGSFRLGDAPPLLGITSPLHVAAVAAFGAVIGVEWTARLIGVLSHVAAAVAAFYLGRHYGRSDRAGLLACAFVSLSGTLTFHSLNGMETTLFAALAAFAWLASLKADSSLKNLIATAVLLGAAILTRPEGWLLGAAIYADLARRLFLENNRRFPRRILAAAALTLAVASPYLIANFLISGSLLPSTASAKAVFFKVGARGIGPSVAATFLGLTKALIRLACFLPFFVLGIGRKADAFRKAPGILLFAALFYFSYALRFGAGLNMYWLRYQAPLLVILFVPAAAGIVIFHSRYASQSRAAVAAAALLLFGNLAFDVNQNLKHYRGDLAATRTIVMETAKFLRETTPPDALVAAHDIGGPLYFTNRRLLDLVGLIDARAAETHRRDKSGALLWQYLTEKKPDYLVMFDSWDRQFLHLHANDRGGVLRPVWKSARDVIPLVQYEVYRCDWQKNAPSPVP